MRGTASPSPPSRSSTSRPAKREVARLLATSQAQLYRLLDQTNYRKSVDQMLGLLRVLRCDVDFVIRERGITREYNVGTRCP